MKVRLFFEIKVQADIYHRYKWIKYTKFHVCFSVVTIMLVEFVLGGIADHITYVTNSSVVTVVKNARR